MSAACLQRANSVPAVFMQCTCSVPAACLQHVCSVPVVCLQCAWSVHAMCLQHACNVPAVCLPCASNVPAACLQCLLCTCSICCVPAACLQHAYSVSAEFLQCQAQGSIDFTDGHTNTETCKRFSKVTQTASCGSKLNPAWKLYLKHHTLFSSILCS